MVTRERFGILTDGREVSLYTIRNGLGESVGVLDYGAAVHSIIVMDGQGVPGDVILGVRKAEELEGDSCEGVTIGRCANRIAGGRYVWKGKTYQLERNRGEDFIHGAGGNYAHQMFSAHFDEAGDSVELRLNDTGAGGFACAAKVRIRFSFDDFHCLTISYEIVPEADTLINPTNHAYFNLRDGKDARGHELFIAADRVAVRGERGIPDGRTADIAYTDMDFRRPILIGEAMRRTVPERKRYDDCFLLRDGSFAAELRAPDTGRTMRIDTDMPGLILFVPYLEKGITGKYGNRYAGHCAVCLETQYVPNAINCREFKAPITRANRIFYSETRYRFGTFNCTGSGEKGEEESEDVSWD